MQSNLPLALAMMVTATHYCAPQLRRLRDRRRSEMFRATQLVSFILTAVWI